MRSAAMRFPILSLALLLAFAVPSAAQDAEPRLLVFSKTVGFRHSSIPAGIQMIREIGSLDGFDVEQSEDASIFTDENLATFDAVVFLSTTGDILNGAQQAAFERFIEGGGGFAGIHAAADTEYDWPWYGGLVGAYFQSHPSIQSATVVVNDRVHPSTRMLPLRWERTDEWYNYRENPRGDVHVLLTLDEDTYSGGEDGHDHPIAWCRPYNGGRSWYTGGGHTEASYAEEFFRDHVAGGLRWVLGLEEGDCTATLDTSYEKTILDDDTDDPMELTVLPDGRVVFVERAGKVKVHDPTTSATTVAGSLPVYTGQEDGLIGITHDPAFENNGWIYLFYSPAGPVSEQRISRFTLSGTTLDLQSEKILMHIPKQRVECCHSGGSLTFGPAGNLYASLGDDSNPFESNGFAPIDERPGREPWDAQRTSANTQDLRGKILRITPQPDGSYTIPEGNLFDDPSEGRPEIYVMGNRNPFRISVDQETGWLYWGEVGPDSDQNTIGRGPRGHDEFNQAREAGNYGWPYCIAENLAYRDYDFASGQSGGYFDCASGPLNTSPNNTGAERLPPAQPAWIWYPYGSSSDFPEMETGGRTAMGGPIYHLDAQEGSARQLPEYYDDTVFIYEWSRNWIREVKLDENGDLLKINPFLSGLSFVRPMDMEIGPDGAIYMLEWGSGFGGGNNDSKLIRIGYTGGQHAPVARATASATSGPVPLTVEFSADGSTDPDAADALTYSWDFDGDGTEDSDDPNVTHTYTEPGNYTARLTVTDADGMTGVASVPVIAGNTMPIVTILQPPHGGFFDWGDVIPFAVLVEDAEDGSSEGGSLNCEDVVVQPGIGHDDHNHTLSAVHACEGTFATARGHGSDGANVFHVLTASYTDSGAEGVGPLTASETIVLRPKRLQAEHFTPVDDVQVIDATDPLGGADAVVVRIGDAISYPDVNLTGIDSVSFRLSTYRNDGIIEVRADALDGPLLARVGVASTGGTLNWADVSTPVADPGGLHDLFVVFTREGGGTGSLFVVNWVDFSGEGVATSIEGGRPGLPRELRATLHGAYPNPFSTETRITFSLERTSDVQLEVFDLLGRRVAVLVDGPMPAGSHVAPFRSESDASGVYFYRLKTPQTTLVRQMTVVR